MRTKEAQSLIVAILFLSAMAKLADFGATADTFASMFGRSEQVSALALCLLIVVEMTFAWLLVVKPRSVFTTRGVQLLAFGFVVATLFMWIEGQNNCACFGAWMQISPKIAFIKNLFFLFLAFRVSPVSEQSVSTNHFPSAI